MQVFHLFHLLNTVMYMLCTDFQLFFLCSQQNHDWSTLPSSNDADESSSRFWSPRKNFSGRTGNRGHYKLLPARNIYISYKSI